MPVIEINGVPRKVACGPCIRGHRSTKCTHDDRIMLEVRKPGRPLSSCPHSKDSCTCNRVVVNYTVPKGTGCPAGAVPKGDNAQVVHLTQHAPLPPTVPESPQEQAPLRLGMLGVGGYRAAPDEMGWEGEWPSLESAEVQQRKRDSAHITLPKQEPQTPQIPKKSCCGGAKSAPEASTDRERRSATVEHILTPVQSNNVGVNGTPSANFSVQFGQYGDHQPFVFGSTNGAFGQNVIGEPYTAMASPAYQAHMTSELSHLQDITVPADHFDDGTGGNCHCGEDCQCLGCAAHPRNTATVNYVADLYPLLVEETSGRPRKSMRLSRDFGPTTSAAFEFGALYSPIPTFNHPASSPYSPYPFYNGLDAQPQPQVQWTFPGDISDFAATNGHSHNASRTHFGNGVNGHSQTAESALNSVLALQSAVVEHPQESSPPAAPKAKKSCCSSKKRAAEDDPLPADSEDAAKADVEKQSGNREASEANGQLADTPSSQPSPQKTESSGPASPEQPILSGDRYIINSYEIPMSGCQCGDGCACIDCFEHRNKDQFRLQALNFMSLASPTVEAPAPEFPVFGADTPGVADHDHTHVPAPLSSPATPACCGVST